MNTDILGRGMAYPLAIGPRGGISQSREEQKVRESILMILGTEHGERVMRPAYGANLKSLAFAPNNGATAGLARHYVEEALTRWEPRILLTEVRVDNDNAHGRLLIHVSYRLKSTHDPQNLVFPFYLGR
jgi:phage baseplate assembly protein W